MKIYKQTVIYFICLFLLKFSDMLQFARIVRQNEQKKQVRQAPVHPTHPYASNQNSKIFTRSSTNKSTQTCNIRCGSSLLAIGVIILIVGLRIGGTAFIIIGPICSAVGLIFLLTGMDGNMKKKIVSSGKRIDIVVLQKKKATIAQETESGSVGEDKRKGVLLKPYVVTEVESSPVFDRAGRFHIDVSDTGSLYVVG